MSQKAHNSSTMNNCKACERPDDERMVQCRQCTSWWHHTCTGIDVSGDEKDFYCSQCTRSPPSGAVIVDKAASIAGNSSTSSHRARARLTLQKLEAQKVLMEKQLELDRRDQERKREQEKIQKDAEFERKKLQLEQEFTDLKFRLLEDELEENDIDRRSMKSRQGNIDRVQQWRGQHPLYTATSPDDQLPRDVTEVGAESVPVREVTQVTSAISNGGAENQIDGIVDTSETRRSETMNVGNISDENARCSMPAIRARSAQFHIPVSSEHQRQTAASNSSQFVVGHAAGEFFHEGGLLSSRMTHATINATQNFESEIPRSSREIRNTPLDQNRREINNRFDRRAEAVNDMPLTSHQLAARQVMPRELPVFTGNPEDWPCVSKFDQWPYKICMII
ncbi:uncharacterized protein LOC129777849 isoform X2 [Toxorhynchites rutilus septentrionalis]|uniref:uncharacterized protein LOC129777849 isoform X2 n=1 Tax=Toxorhynchites rutilus septentrionalis TaxID=329112 RepID=UPI00247B1EBF|nr:uncharacterized protein LOC129777849 isoform X2 [Toxorhynchites rutilus septentrionalis]XP_055640374.1 uncharacterized protein LOC129777849 isoform X2 [Toxorhynchites rutilus septentrionalis]